MFGIFKSGIRGRDPAGRLERADAGDPSCPVVLALRTEAFLTEGALSPGRIEMTRLTRTPFLRAVALFGALLLPSLPWAAPARAQTADATVEIDVVDETGVALPGVSVELKRAETGFARTSVLVRQGRRPLPGRPAGGGLHGEGRAPGLRAGRAGADAPDRPDGEAQGRPPRQGRRRDDHGRRRSARRGRLQDRLVDEHRPRADQGRSRSRTASSRSSRSSRRASSASGASSASSRAARSSARAATPRSRRSSSTASTTPTPPSASRRRASRRTPSPSSASSTPGSTPRSAAPPAAP